MYSLGKVVQHIDDKNVPLVYISEGEGAAFAVTVVVTNLTTLTTYNVHVGSPMGGKLHETVTIMCDFTAVPKGDNYKIEVNTDVSVITDGLLARGGLVVLGEDGYSI